MTKLRHRARCSLRALLFVGMTAICCASVGCVSSTARIADGMRLDIPEEGPEPGPLEEQARRYLLDITEILNRPAEEPRETVRGIGGYLQEHQDAIRATFRELGERVAAMSERDRVYYEERFSAYFAQARLDWNTSLDSFRERHPRAAARIDGLMTHFD